MPATTDDDIETTKLSIRNTHPGPGTRILNDVAVGSVEFQPNETKTVEVSKKFAEQLKAGRGDWEIGNAKDATEKSDQPQTQHTQMDMPPQRAQQTSNPLGVAGVQESGTPRTAQAGSKMKRDELQGMTKDELVQHAEDQGIEVSPSWLKDEIVDAIVKGQK